VLGMRLFASEDWLLCPSWSRIRAIEVFVPLRPPAALCGPLLPFGSTKMNGSHQSQSACVKPGSKPASAGEPRIVSVSAEARTIHKVRIRIIPFLFLLYIIAFVDRTNISIAVLDRTMGAQLALTSRQFWLAAGIFFIGYFVFEIPSNLLLHKIGARIWIARILISWGIIAVVTGLVQSVFQLYAARFLLGVAEAGFFPGIVLYLTYWFRQREQAQAIALFMAALPVCGILCNPISGLILDHVRWLGVGGWRWLLILEGIPAVVCGVVTYFVLPNGPAEANFLTKEEKGRLIAGLGHDEGRHQAQRPITVIQALTDRRVWHLVCIYLPLMFASMTMTFGMPSWVKNLSSTYSNTVVGFLVAIPYLVGLVAMILVSRSSDRKLELRYHAAIPAAVGGIAFLLLRITISPLLTILLLSFVVLGIYSFCGPFWSLPGRFLTGFSAASGIALINSVGNLGGFVGPYAMRAFGERTGLALAAGCLFLAAAFVLLVPKQEKSRGE
jgi:MFS transporter, ACS family, tartrate transporter